MCGILGIVGRNWESQLPGAAPQAALDLMQARGPDAEGIYTDDDVWLGHRRLSIIDIGGAAQPMVSPDSGEVLIYNGEVVNFQSLAATLGLRGPASKSDTAVVLEACRRWGHGAYIQMRGMFALGKYDPKHKRLVAARDPLGIKPLYYAQVGDCLVFGSEIEPVRRVAGATKIDTDAYVSYLRYSYIPEPATIYANVRALRPGHYLDFCDGVLHVREYWRPGIGRTTSPANASVDVLKAATELSTIADVPVASLLSGGIDSALLASFLGRSTTYYNLRFPGDYDESRNAAYSAQKLGVPLECVDAEMSLTRPETLALVGRVGQPFGDTSLFACHRVFSRVAEGHKVCLSGDGADEVFAGYPMRKVIALQRAVGPGLRLGVGRRLAKHALMRILRGYFHRTRLAVDEIVRPDVLRDHHDLYWEAIEQDVDWALERSDDLVNIVSYLLVRRNLPNDMLTKVDRASMTSSLEVRVPFLDHHVVEAGLLLPGHAKQTMNETKRPLRASLRRRGFEPVFLNTPKSGFGPAPQTWADRVGPWPLEGDLSDVLSPSGRVTMERSIYGRMAGAWQAAARGDL